MMRHFIKGSLTNEDSEALDQLGHPHEEKYNENNEG